MEWLAWVKAHWMEMAGVMAFVVVIGERIAAVTENKEDDAFFDAVHKMLAALGLKFPEVK